MFSQRFLEFYNLFSIFIHNSFLNETIHDLFILSIFQLHHLILIYLSFKVFIFTTSSPSLTALSFSMASICLDSSDFFLFLSDLRRRKLDLLYNTPVIERSIWIPDTFFDKAIVSENSGKRLRVMSFLLIKYCSLLLIFDATHSLNTSPKSVCAIVEWN